MEKFISSPLSIPINISLHTKTKLELITENCNCKDNIDHVGIMLSPICNPYVDITMIMFIMHFLHSMVSH
jgi:hypothetical protein